ncbi:uncharacterized protein VP01_4248g2 [Puccinia sorghi]|uniref:Uncharacterized protein n=1 Tax=Puccinia sorghi TaxID=27349 RepID=A0A0L6USE5_9BASI|nr:uncharacterized protein VP01_4248g2 [Puccinia sorghi]
MDSVGISCEHQPPAQISNASQVPQPPYQIRNASQDGYLPGQLATSNGEAGPTTSASLGTQSKSTPAASVGTQPPRNQAETRLINPNPPNLVPAPSSDELNPLQSPSCPPIPPQLSKPSNNFCLSPEAMASYIKMPTHQLRALQSAHIRFPKLNEEVKLAAEALYMEYHRKSLLLSLEYSRPAVAIAKHLGQAQQVFHEADLDLSERNILVAAGYNQTNLPSSSTVPLVQSKEGQEDFARKKKMVLQKKMMEWGSSTDSRNFTFFEQLKEISDAIQIKGILVLASQDHTSHFFFQGGTVIQLVASIHLPPVPRAGFYLPQRAQTIKGPKTRSPRQAPGAEIYKDVCKGSAAKNQAYLSSILGKMFLDASGGDSCGWPGRNTDAGLAEFKLKLVIKKNKLELESILKSKPIKSMNLEHTWRLLSGLQKKIIKLEKIEDRKVLSVDGGDQQVQVNTDVVMEPAPLLGDDEGLSDSE